MKSWCEATALNEHHLVYIWNFIVSSIFFIAHFSLLVYKLNIGENTIHNISDDRNSILNIAGRISA